MSQKSITSFFTRKPAQTKKDEDLKTKNSCESSKRKSTSPSPENRGKRKRPQVIYSDDEEETETGRDSPVKSPVKKKMTEDSEATESPDKAESTPNSPVKESTKPPSPVKREFVTSIRKTAPITLPLGGELHPGIRQAIEEHRKRETEKKLNGGTGDLSSTEESPEKMEIDNQASEPSSSNKSPDNTSDKENVKNKSPKQAKVSPKSKLSIFKKKKNTSPVKNVTKEPKANESSESDTKETISAEPVEGESLKTETTNGEKEIENSDGTKISKVSNESLKTESTNVEKEIKNGNGTKVSKESKESLKTESTDDEKEIKNGDGAKMSKESPKKKEIHPMFGIKKGKDGKTVSPAPDPGASYDPSKSKYHPIDDAFWKHGQKVPYLALARTLEEIENVTARLKIVEILSNYFRSVMVLSPDDLLPSIYLCLNKLAPAYHSLELGVAETTLLKTIAQSTGRSTAQIKADATAAGDLGIVAEQSKSTQRMMFKPAPLTVRGVFDKLKEIAHMTGQASMGKKVDKMQAMFVACRYSEARFLIRSLAGKLRIGLAEQSVLQALAQACVNTPPCQDFPPEVICVAKSMPAESFKARLDEEALIIKTTYCKCPNYDMIVPVILSEGVRALPQHCRLTPGIPLKPMLAHPTKGVSEVLERFDGLRFTCEWKYDGERAQIHLSEDGTVSIYSRNQENNTTKYPDIVSRLGGCVGPDVRSCVLDTEAVAWDNVNKRIQPFQVLSTRKKKDCVESEIKVQVCVFMFDLLYLNGESLVQKTLLERRKLLHDNFKTIKEQFEFATSLDTSTVEEVQEFLEESVKGNCEGLMVKTLESDATYEIAKRSHNWLKLKKDYLEGVGDTLDLVVIGGYLGKGKRVGVYGGFLLACYNPDTEEYQSVCKIGTGFSDEALQKHSETLKEQVIPSPRPYYRYDSSHEPDHWFDAASVWEVKCADLSLSPVHRAALGIVDPDKGISLRFPRFVRIRDDKQAEESTSAQQVADMYKNQDQIKNQQGDSKKIAEEDFY